MEVFDPNDSAHPINDDTLTIEDLRELARRDTFRGTDYGQVLTEAANGLELQRSRLSLLSEAALWAFEFCYHRDVMNAKVHCAPVRYSPITERLALALVESIHGCEQAEEVLRSVRSAF